MDRKFKYLVKNVGILTISNFASKIMVFLLVPLYTSVLSTEEYGTYDLVVSTVQVVFPLLTLNIVDAVMRFAMDKSKSIDEIATIGLRYIIRSCIPITFFLIICNTVSIFNNIKGYELLIGLYFGFYVFNQFLIQFAKGLEQVIPMGIAGILSTIFLVVGNIVFLVVLKNGLQGFFVANILCQAISGIYLSYKIKLWRYIRTWKINQSLQKEMLLYCLPLIFTTLSWWINNMSDKYAVALICGTAANGILSVSYKIPSILNTIQQIFIQAWQISAIKEYGEEETKKFYGDTFCYINLLMCFCCSVLILLTKFLATLLFANDFYSASGLLGPILLAVKDSKNMAKSALYGAIFNIVFNIILICVIGIQGAAVATAISSYIIYHIRKKAVGDKIVIDSYWKVLFSWVIICIQATFEIFSINKLFQLFLILLIILINIEYIKKMTYIIRQFLKKR